MNSSNKEISEYVTPNSHFMYFFNSFIIKMFIQLKKNLDCKLKEK